MPIPTFCGRWECRDSSHDKFYEIRSINSTTFECTYGAIGSNGVTIEKSYDEVMKKVNNFSAKGYIQVSQQRSTPTHSSRPEPKSKPIIHRNRLASIEGEEPESKTTEEKHKPKGRLGSI